MIEKYIFLLLCHSLKLWSTFKSPHLQLESKNIIERLAKYIKTIILIIVISH